MTREQFMSKSPYLNTNHKSWSPTTSRFLRREIASLARRGPTPDEVRLFLEQERNAPKTKPQHFAEVA